MKIFSTLLFILPAFILLQSNTLYAQKSTKYKIGEEKELAAIMAVIEAETDCFYARDHDCWKNTWVNEAHAYHAWNNSDGTFYAQTGWERINKAAKEYIKNNPVKPDGPKRNVFRNNMEVKFITANVALLVWDQYNEAREGDKYYYSKDSRLMEKKDDQWRIAQLIAFWDYKNLLTGDEVNKLVKSDKD